MSSRRPAADPLGVDFLVVGCRGLGTLKGLLAGTVPQTVHIFQNAAASP